MAGETGKDYVLGRLALDYIKVFMWPLVAVVVVVIYQEDVRKNAAVQSVEQARRIWPEYHNVAEIGRALRKREDRLRDPESPGWQQLYREIITRYSWGLPEDLRKAIRQGATQAY